MDSFSYNSEFKLHKLEVIIQISSKLALKPMFLWGWKILNIKIVLYALQAKTQKRWLSKIYRSMFMLQYPWNIKSTFCYREAMLPLQ